jgi:hypothetical protein
MTEQAPPDYYFQNIIFNPKYYDNEVNNNITTYEANNTYLKKPINQNTGLINSVLTLTNTTTKEMQWTTPAVAITNYTNYNSTNKTLISNVSGTSTTITDLVISDSIGESTAEKFQLPFNTSSTTVGSGTYFLTIANNTKNSFWAVPFGNVAYDGSSYKFSTNNPSIVDITNIALDGQIGKTNQLFTLPSNTSSASVNSVLTLSNTTNKTTTWTTIPNITNYLNYNSTNKTLISNVSGTPTTVSDLVMSGSIGSSTAQKFVLPSNSSTAPLNSVLTLSNTSTKATTWTTISNITNYTNYNSTNKTLISNVSGTPTTVSDLVMSGSIGSSTAQKFVLPSNSSTAPLNSVLTLSNTSTKATIWVSPTSLINNYVNYNLLNNKLASVISGTASDITTVVVDNIGKESQTFILPSNTSSASVNSVLTLSNTSTKATTWTTISNITNYTNYNSTNKTLISNVSGTPTTVSDLVMSGSIGSSTAQKFVLPSNSSTATLNSVLTLSNTSTKATIWVSPTSLINNYVNYNLLNNKLASVISGTATDITTVVVDNIGKESQTFILPSNTSSASVNSVLTLSNTSTKATTWTTIPTITNYTNYNSTNKTLISNVSGTPTTVSDLSIGDLTCTSIDATSGLIETTGNLQSRGLTIKNTSNVNVATISNSGALDVFIYK